MTDLSKCINVFMESNFDKVFGDEILSCDNVVSAREHINEFLHKKLSADEMYHLEDHYMDLITSIANLSFVCGLSNGVNLTKYISNGMLFEDYIKQYTDVK